MKFVHSSAKLMLSILLTGLVLPLGQLSALAIDDGAFGCGVTLFNQGKYSGAMNYFKSIEKDSAYDPRLFYYEALCYHRMGQLAAARTNYQRVIDRFPDSDAAELARKGLGVIDFGSGYDRPGGSLAKLDRLRMDIVPPQVVLPCQEKDGKPLVDVTVDGKKIAFIVDPTVASTVLGIDLVRANSLNSISLSAKKAKAAEKKAEIKTESKTESKTTVPAGATDASVSTTSTTTTDMAADTTTHTTTATEAAIPDDDAFIVLYDLNVGPIQRPGFPVLLSPAKPKIAVIGRDFLGPYKTTFNPTAKTLTLMRDHAYDNPFTAGMAFFNKAKYKQAVPLLKRAVDARPNDPRPLYCYASSLQRSGNLELAKVTYKQVITRFPNSEATFYSSAALSSIDPTFNAGGRGQTGTAGPRVGGGTTKVIDTFDVPYVMDNNNMKVTCYVDGRPCDMYVDWNRQVFNLTTPQLAQIDASYIADLTEVSRTMDESNSNLMLTTVVKRGFFKNVRLGQAEKRRAPIEVTDSGPARYEMTWNSAGGWVGNYKPYLPIQIFQGWKFDTMDDLKVLRFTRQPTR